MNKEIINNKIVDALKPFIDGKVLESTFSDLAEGIKEALKGQNLVIAESWEVQGMPLVVVPINPEFIQQRPSFVVQNIGNDSVAVQGCVIDMREFADSGMDGE